jgi:hypothetical protein
MIVKVWLFVRLGADERNSNAGKIPQRMHKKKIDLRREK